MKITILCSTCLGRKAVFTGMLYVLLSLLLAGITSSCVPPERVTAGGQSHAAGRDSAKAKYVFLFIGDGMGTTIVHVAEQLQAAEGGRLAMSSFPVHGMQGTANIDGATTDSGAAATALACGAKTSAGTIAMDAAHQRHYKSIARILKEQAGWRIGIISSVYINHATPAGFYASVPSRGNYREIAAQMPGSGFEFFGGGIGIISKVKEDPESVVNTNGYMLIDDEEQIRALLARPRERVVCLNEMPYGIDDGPHVTNGLTLAEYLQVGLACLGTDSPFFMMIEGGRIDWAGHGNDAGTMAREVIAMDDAIRVALDFAADYPDETLIVVTADHDTGGLEFDRDDRTLADGGQALRGQRVSYMHFKDVVWPHYRSRKQTDFDTSPFTIATESDGEFAGIMKTHFGIDYETLTADERGVIEAAFARRFGGDVALKYDEASMKSDKPKLVRRAIFRVIEGRSGITWQTEAHTGVDVPVYATGAGADAFAGRYENADIPRKILAAAGLKEIVLPVIAE